MSILDLILVSSPLAIIIASKTLSLKVALINWLLNDNYWYFLIAGFIDSISLIFDKSSLTFDRLTISCGSVFINFGGLSLTFDRLINSCGSMFDNFTAFF